MLAKVQYIGRIKTKNAPILERRFTYVVVGYYPEPNRVTTLPQLVDVPRKETVTTSLVWQPQ